MEIKLYLDDPKGYGRGKLYTALGTMPRYNDIDVDPLARKPQKLKRRQQKREPVPIPEDALENWQYDYTTIVGEPSDEELEPEAEDEAEPESATPARPAARASDEDAQAEAEDGGGTENGRTEESDG